MIRRVIPEGLKSYVPFHFPYTDGIVRTGLEDECGIESWDYWEDSKMEMVESNQFNVGSVYIGYTPMPSPFYCPSNFHGFVSPNSMGRGVQILPFFYDGNKDNVGFGFVVSTNNSGIYNLNSSGNYEFEIFCNYADSIPQTFFGKKAIAAIPTLTKDNKEFKLFLEHYDIEGTSVNDLSLNVWSASANNTWETQIKLSSNIWNINAEESQNLTITDDDYQTEYDEEGLSLGDRKYNSLWIENPKSFNHLVLRITNNIATVYINGYERLSVELPPNVILSPARLKIGGFYGSIKNYAFWHKVRTETLEIPTSIYPMTLNVNEFGGFGTGKDVDKTIKANTGNFNRCGQISSVTNARTFTVNTWAGGNSGVSASNGCEVMIHVTKPRLDVEDEWPYLGMYVFRKIKKLDGKTITLNRSIREDKDGFTLSQDLINTYYVQAIIVPHYQTFTLNANTTITPVSWTATQGGGIVVFRTTGDCTINGIIRTQDYGALRRYDNHTMSHATLLKRFLCCRGGGIIIVCGGKLTLSSTSILGKSERITGTKNNNGYPSRGGGHYGNYTFNGHSSLYTSNNTRLQLTAFDKAKMTSPSKDCMFVSSDTYYYSGGACLILIANKAVIDDGAIQTGGVGVYVSNTGYGGGGGFCYMAIGEFLDG